MSNLPHGWTQVELPDIAALNPGMKLSQEDETAAVSFVPMRAISPEGGGITAPEQRQYGEVKRGYTAFQSGDILMAKITPCMENGKTALVPSAPAGPWFGSTEFHVVRPAAGILGNWIEAYLLRQDVRAAAQRSMSGAVGQMRVPADFLASLRLPLAPTNEQRRIADALDELLSDLDAGVAALERARAKLALYRAAVLKAAVEGSLTANWRAEHPDAEPASKLLERILVERRRKWEKAQLAKFKEKGKAPPKGWRSKYKEPVAPDIASLPSLPEGWCWASLEQLSWDSAYGTSQKCRENNTGLVVLRIPNIIGGRVSLEQLKFAPPEYVASRERLLASGDLLVVRTNGSRTLIGRGAVVTEDPPIPLGFASYLIRFRLASESQIGKWISMLWGSSQVRTWIEARAATSAGQFNVSLSLLHGLPIPLAPTDEQAIIVEAVDDQISVLERLESDVETRVRSAHTLRQSILRHAFSGKLVPQDPNDEPASELLQRISAEREPRPALSNHGRKPVKLQARIRR